MRDPQSLLPLSHVVYHVLLSLTNEDRHGYGIIKDVLERTDGKLELEAGTLYAAIKRLREDDVIRETETPAGADGRRRYYALTPFGRRVIEAESMRLADMVALARDARVIPKG